MHVEKLVPVRAVFEFRELIGGQRGIEFVHDGRIGMAARAKLHDPGAILIAALFRPFLHEIVTKISGRIAAVTTGAGKAAPKMNIFDEILQVHMRRRIVCLWAESKEVLGRLNSRIAVAKDAVVLQHELHLLRTQLQREQRRQMLRPRDKLLFHRLVEELSQIIVQAIVVGALLRGDDRLAVFVFGGEHFRQFRNRRNCVLLCAERGGGKRDAEKDDR